MRVTETIKEIALKVGTITAKIDINTTCLWINYQPEEPRTIIKMRQAKKK